MREPIAAFARDALTLVGTSDRARDRAVFAVLEAVFVALSGGEVATEPLGVAARGLVAAGACDRLDLLGAVYEALLEKDERRARGAHYTSPALRKVVVERTLAGIAMDARSTVCDPAVGAGAFLVETARRRGTVRGLYGVDRDPVAVWLARRNLWLIAEDPRLPLDFADRAIVVGDSLLSDPSVLEPRRTFSWRSSFPEVFERGGFDAVVSNPPWVAFVGRAAQPLEPRVRARFEESSAFRGYKTLHGLFVERSATLVRAGGRIGLVLPTSIADLQGYAPTRAAHDRLSIVDASLPDFGNGQFQDVFQPCMALLSTRRSAPIEAEGAPWPLERTGIDPTTLALIEKLAKLPRLPPTLFAERGYQTTRVDRAHFRAAGEAFGGVRVRRGADIGPFGCYPASLRCEPTALSSKFRAPDEWRAVRLLIRQTARFPMVCLSDGVAFRNSIIAGFENEVWPAELLVAYLNASPVRFFHYFSHRDARQGMPQLKVAHLRALPGPELCRSHARALRALGLRLSKANAGVAPSDQGKLDALVSEILGLDAEERVCVAEWAKRCPVPVRRG